jgi:hypothetical protein
MIEGRFGNSIRFGSTINNTISHNPNIWSQGSRDNIGDPITIIRNGQHQEGDVNETKLEHILEDVHRDHSTIYLCSNQQIPNFIPASKHDESYLNEMIKELDLTQETSISETEFPENLSEDVALNTARPIPPQELQESDELSNFQNPSVAAYDSTETEEMSIGPNDSITVDADSAMIIPDTVNDEYLNEEI